MAWATQGARSCPWGARGKEKGPGWVQGDSHAASIPWESGDRILGQTQYGPVYPHWEAREHWSQHTQVSVKELRALPFGQAEL